jgi:hypothetical protein
MGSVAQLLTHTTTPLGVPFKALFVVHVVALADHTLRIRMTEKNGPAPRYEVREVRAVKREQSPFGIPLSTHPPASFVVWSIWPRNIEVILFAGYLHLYVNVGHRPQMFFF